MKPNVSTKSIYQVLLKSLESSPPVFTEKLERIRENDITIPQIIAEKIIELNYYHYYERLADCVYFLQRGDGAIRIGQSNSIERSQRGLETKHGKLVLLGTYPFSSNKKHFHKALVPIRIKKQGVSEWYAPHPALIQFIKDECFDHQLSYAEVRIKEMFQNLREKLSQLAIEVRD